MIGDIVISYNDCWPSTLTSLLIPFQRFSSANEKNDPQIIYIIILHAYMQRIIVQNWPISYSAFKNHWFNLRNTFFGRCTPFQVELKFNVTSLTLSSILSRFFKIESALKIIYQSHYPAVIEKSPKIIIRKYGIIEGFGCEVILFLTNCMTPLKVYTQIKNHPPTRFSL